MPRPNRGRFDILLWALFAGFLLFMFCSVFLYPQIQALRSAKVEIAQYKTKKTITEACKSYWRDHGNQWPEKLELLVIPDKDGKTYLDDVDVIVDPWGNQYQYDPAGPRNRGQQPDIWCTSPSGEVIGNW